MATVVERFPLRAIGRYEIVRPIAGVLYAARDRAELRARPVVLAVLAIGSEDAERLAEEVERAKRLVHPAVARVVELLEHEGRSVLVYEATPDMSLAGLMSQLTSERTKLADCAIAYLGAALFGALAAAHGQADGERNAPPIVHADLGPHQVFLSWHGEVKLVGFGALRIAQLERGFERAPAGRDAFAAPEVRAGRAPSMGSNVYSAAALLWSLFTQRTPDEQSARVALLAELRPDLPPDICGALDRALEPGLLRRSVECQKIARIFERLANPEGQHALRTKLATYRSTVSAEPALATAAWFPPSFSFHTQAASADDDPEELHPTPLRPPPLAPSRRPGSEPPTPRLQPRRPAAPIEPSPVAEGPRRTAARVVPDPGELRAAIRATAARASAVAQTGGADSEPEPATDRSPTVASAGAPPRERVPTRGSRSRQVTSRARAPRQGAPPRAPLVTAEVRAPRELRLGDARVEPDESVRPAQRSPRQPPNRRHDAGATGAGKQAPGYFAPLRRGPTVPPPPPARLAVDADAIVAAIDAIRTDSDDALAAPPSRVGAPAQALASDAAAQRLPAMLPSGALGARPLRATRARAAARDDERDAVGPVLAAASPGELPVASSDVPPPGTFSATNRPQARKRSGLTAWLIAAGVLAASIGAALTGAGPLRRLLRTAGTDPAAAPAPASPVADPPAGPVPSEPPALDPAPGTSDRGGGGACCTTPPGAPATAPEAAPDGGDDDDGAALPTGYGYLLVGSSASDATVYAAGALAGAVGEKIRVRCGNVVVRLGPVPPRGWISGTVRVPVACQRVTRVWLEPRPPAAGRAPKAPAERGARFDPYEP